LGRGRKRGGKVGSVDFEARGKVRKPLPSWLRGKKEEREGSLPEKREKKKKKKKKERQVQ